MRPSSRAIDFLYLTLIGLLCLGAVSSGCVSPAAVQGRTATGEVEYTVDPDRLATRARELQNELRRSQFVYEPPKVPPGHRVVLSFVHVSDVQIRDYGLLSQGITASKLADFFVPGTERQPGIDTREEYPFLAQVDTINGMQEAPAFMIHTGDSSEVATVGELLSFLSVANLLEIPWFNVPGNHDFMLFGNFKQGFRLENTASGISFITDRGQFIRLHGRDWRLRGFPPIYGRHAPTADPSVAGDQPDSDASTVSLAETTEEERQRLCKDDPEELERRIVPPSSLHGFDCDASEMNLQEPRCDSAPKPFYSFSTRTDPPLRIVVLDTNAFDARIPRWRGTQRVGIGAAGAVEEDQFAWLQQQLLDADRRGESVLVIGHHPLSELAGDGMRIRKLLTAENPESPRRSFLLDELRRNKVLAYFGGHKHAGYLILHSGEPKPGNEEALGVCRHKCFLEVIAPSLHEFPQIALLIRVLEEDRGSRLWIDVSPISPKLKEGDWEAYRKACHDAIENIPDRKQIRDVRTRIEEACRRRGEGGVAYCGECYVDPPRPVQQNPTAVAGTELMQCSAAVGADENEQPWCGTPDSDCFRACVPTQPVRFPTLARFSNPFPKSICQGQSVDLSMVLRGAPPFQLSWWGGRERDLVAAEDERLQRCDAEGTKWVFTRQEYPKRTTHYELTGFSDHFGDGVVPSAAKEVRVNPAPGVLLVTTERSVDITGKGRQRACIDEKPQLRSSNGKDYIWRRAGTVQSSSGETQPNVIEIDAGAETTVTIGDSVGLKEGFLQFYSVSYPSGEAPKGEQCPSLIEIDVHPPPRVVKVTGGEACEESVEVAADLVGFGELHWRWNGETEWSHKVGGGRVSKRVSESGVYYIEALGDSVCKMQKIDRPPDGDPRLGEVSVRLSPEITREPVGGQLGDDGTLRLEVEAKNDSVRKWYHSTLDGFEEEIESARGRTWHVADEEGIYWFVASNDPCPADESEHVHVTLPPEPPTEEMEEELLDPAEPVPTPETEPTPEPDEPPMATES
jgi:3',5'-cyclic AMP phosphodiesterase CpdA